MPDLALVARPRLPPLLTGGASVGATEWCGMLALPDGCVEAGRGRSARGDRGEGEGEEELELDAEAPTDEAEAEAALMGAGRQ